VRVCSGVCVEDALVCGCRVGSLGAIFWALWSNLDGVVGDGRDGASVLCFLAFVEAEEVVAHWRWSLQVLRSVV